MPFDLQLASRLRELLADEPEVTEKKLFGGLAFLVCGNMAVAASSQGGIMVRVDPSEADMLVDTSPARFMEMQGRPMRGWLVLDPDDVASADELARWVALGCEFARSLPPKR